MFIYVQEQSEDLVVAFSPKRGGSVVVGVGLGWANWTFIYLFILISPIVKQDLLVELGLMLLSHLLLLGLTRASVGTHF